VEEFTTDGQWGKQNIITKFVAGNERFEVRRSKYGRKEVSTTQNGITMTCHFFSDAGHSSMTINGSRHGQETTP
jgi:hypothetical protein